MDRSQQDEDEGPSTEKETALMNQFGISPDKRDMGLNIGGSADDKGGRLDDRSVSASDISTAAISPSRNASKARRSRKTKAESDASLDTALELLTAPLTSPDRGSVSPRVIVKTESSPRLVGDSIEREDGATTDDASNQRQVDLPSQTVSDEVHLEDLEVTKEGGYQRQLDFLVEEEKIEAETRANDVFQASTVPLDFAVENNENGTTSTTNPVAPTAVVQMAVPPTSSSKVPESVTSSKNPAIPESEPVIRVEKKTKGKSKKPVSAGIATVPSKHAELVPAQGNSLEAMMVPTSSETMTETEETRLDAMPKDKAVSSVIAAPELPSSSPKLSLTSTISASKAVSSSPSSPSVKELDGTERVTTEQISAAPDDAEKKALRLAKEWEFKHGLPVDLSRLVLTVGEPKLFGGSTSSLVQTVVTNVVSDGHIRFKITRALPHDSEISPQFVHRRYRDFQALCLRLAHCYPALVLPGLPSTLTAIIKSEEFLHTRSRRLEGYLVALLRGRQQIWTSQDIAAFLLSDSEAFDEMATKYLSNNGQDLDVAPPTVSSKLGESLSSWVRSAQVTLSVAAGSPPPSNAVEDHRLELSSSFEALNSWVDAQSVVQERSSTVEDLTSAFESLLSISQSRTQVLDAMKAGMDDLLKDDSDQTEDAYLSAFDSTSEATFARGIIGEARTLGEETNEGPLRSLHQCAASLGGAKDLHARVMSATHPLLVKDADHIKKQFSALRKRTSNTALRVAQEFTRLSAEKAAGEVIYLESLRDRMEKQSEL